MFLKKLIFYVGCIAIAAGFFTAVLYSQLNKAFELIRKENELVKQIEIEKEKQEELNKKADYYETDEFVEKVAREQLGFIKHDEVIFKTE